MRGWFEVRWWWWNSNCEFSVYPNMAISDIGAETCFRMSNGTWNSHTIPLCMVETVTCNTGVVSYPIHPYVMCNARLVSTSENV